MLRQNEVQCTCGNWYNRSNICTGRGTVLAIRESFYTGDNIRFVPKQRGKEWDKKQHKAFGGS